MSISAWKNAERAQSKIEPDVTPEDRIVHTELVEPEGLGIDVSFSCLNKDGDLYALIQIG
jgi:hypothetical protein